MGRGEERGDRREQQQGGQHAPQGRDHRVAPGPSPVALRGADLPGLDRLVGQEPPQVLGQGIGRLVAVVGVLVDRLGDDRLQVPGNLGVDRSRPGRLLVLDPLDQPQAIRRVVGRAEGQELVEGQAQGVEVGPGVPLAPEPLGGHVAERAEDVAAGGQAVVVGLGQAEVGDPDDALGVQQQVRRLDVAVDDPPGVGVGQPLRRLSADLGDAPEVRPAMARGVHFRDVLAAGQDRRGRRARRASGPAGRRASGCRAAGPRSRRGRVVRSSPGRARRPRPSRSLRSLGRQSARQEHPGRLDEGTLLQVRGRVGRGPTTVTAPGPVLRTWRARGRPPPDRARGAGGAPRRSGRAPGPG